MNSDIQVYSGLKTRVSTALILSGALFALQGWAVFSLVGTFVFGFALTAAIIICALEFSAISSQKPTVTKKNLVILISYPFIVAAVPVVLLTSWYLHGDWLPLTVLYGRISALGIGALLLALVLACFLGRTNRAAAMQTCAELSIGIVLIGIGGSTFILLPLFAQTVWWFWWMALIVVASDIGAYFAGKQFGNMKLAPEISPGKTIAGSCGGTIAAVLIGAIFALLFPLQISIAQAVVLALALSLCGQIGDLAKSLVKREHSVKDSGWILPGHGGMLDRLDGMLAAAVVLNILLPAFVFLP